MKRKKGNASLRSVTRITDPRYPGVSLRITELKHDGPLFAARQVDGKPRYQKLTPEVTWISLGATNKERLVKATALALDLIERIATEADEEEEPGAPLTLGGLIKRYEVDGLHGRPEQYRHGMLKAVKSVRDYFGADLAVRDLKPSHVQKWMAHRSAQGVLVAGQRDLVGLSIVINWAIGETLLPEHSNPLATKAVRAAMRTDHQPKRPVATRERYEQLKTVAGKLPPTFGVLLDLAWHAGHRLSAMLGLRWRDVTFERAEKHPFGAITWYAGVRPDKKKREHEMPMNAEASAALLRWKERTSAIGNAYVFPDARDATKPLSRFEAKRWLKQAESKAKLSHVAQGGWHMFRRGWATARKPFPIQDVTAAGGWKDQETPATIYQQADAETTKRVALHVA